MDTTTVLLAFGMCFPFLVVSLAKPKAGRIYFGILFVLTSMINFLIGLLNPQILPPITDYALIPLYRDITIHIIAPIAAPFLFLLAAFELAVGVLMLSKHTSVKIGLVGGLVFCVSIIPVGPETVANVLLAAGLAWLLTKRYDRTVLDMLRAKFHPTRRTPAEAS